MYQMKGRYALMKMTMKNGIHKRMMEICPYITKEDKDFLDKLEREQNLGKYYDDCRNDYESSGCCKTFKTINHSHMGIKAAKLYVGKSNRFYTQLCKR